MPGRPRARAARRIPRPAPGEDGSWTPWGCWAGKSRPPSGGAPRPTDRRSGWRACVYRSRKHPFMNSRRLGRLEVPAMGYGAMVLSPGMYGPIDDESGLAARRHVFERGAGFVDTSDGYGHDFHNETLVGRALAGWRGGEVVVATKFGFRFPPDAQPHRVRVGYARRGGAGNAEP